MTRASRITCVICVQINKGVLRATVLRAILKVSYLPPHHPQNLPSATPPLEPHAAFPGVNRPRLTLDSLSVLAVLTQLQHD